MHKITSSRSSNLREVWLRGGSTANQAQPVGQYLPRPGDRLNRLCLAKEVEVAIVGVGAKVVFVDLESEPDQILAGGQLDAPAVIVGVIVLLRRFDVARAHSIREHFFLVGSERETTPGGRYEKT